MKDPCVVLRQKEIDIVRVRQEIQAIRSVIPLLADDVEQRVRKNAGGVPASAAEEQLAARNAASIELQ